MIALTYIQALVIIIISIALVNTITSIINKGEKHGKSR